MKMGAYQIVFVAVLLLDKSEKNIGDLLPLLLVWGDCLPDLDARVEDVDQNETGGNLHLVAELPGSQVYQELVDFEVKEEPRDELVWLTHIATYIVEHGD